MPMATGRMCANKPDVFATFVVNTHLHQITMLSPPLSSAFTMHVLAWSSAIKTKVGHLTWFAKDAQSITVNGVKAHEIPWTLASPWFGESLQIMQPIVTSVLSISWGLTEKLQHTGASQSAVSYASYSSVKKFPHLYLKIHIPKKAAVARMKLKALPLPMTHSFPMTTMSSQNFFSKWTKRSCSRFKFAKRLCRTSCISFKG